MEVFKEHVFLANTLQEYLHFIEVGLAKKSDQKKLERKEFAFSHSWPNSIKALENALNF